MHKHKKPIILAATIALITLIAYLPALQNEFVLWDDDLYVYDNHHIRTLDLKFFTWAFTDVSQAGLWHPVTWISHALDYALWGLHPAGHHLTSILLHTVNTFLIVLLISWLIQIKNDVSRYSTPEGERGPSLSPGSDQRAAMMTAGIVGVLFGIHPLRVESVAWVAERKDLLCGLFFILSIMAYIRYAMSREKISLEGGERSFLRDKQYILSLALFILASCSKPMAVTLPLVLVMLDWYPLGRMRSRRSALRSLSDKVPYLLVSVLLTIVTIMAQIQVKGLSPIDSLPIITRIYMAFKTVIAYLSLIILPVHLKPLYLHPGRLPLMSYEHLFAAALVICITIICALQAKKRPLWLVLWGFYIITLAPTLGFFQSGSQAMADRFTYLPGVAPFLVLGLGSTSLWMRADRRAQGRQRAQVFMIFAAGILLGIMVYGTLQQIGVWKNSTVLWTRVIEDEPRRFPLAYVNRGISYALTGDAEKALSDFNAALAIEDTKNAAYLAYANRGALYRQRGELDRARGDLDRAIFLNPGYADAFINRGRLSGDTGQLERALEDYTRALELGPPRFDVYFNRGLAFKGTGQFSRAIEDYTKALALDPLSVEAYNNRAVAYKYLGRPDLAIADYSKAIDIDPSFYLAYCNRGIVYTMVGRHDEAIVDYSKALSLKPDLIKAYIDRGDLYRSTGKRELSVLDYRKACELGSHEGCVRMLDRTGP